MSARLAALVIGTLLAGCAAQPRPPDQTCGSLPPVFTPPITCPLVGKNTKRLEVKGSRAYDSSSKDHE